MGSATVLNIKPTDWPPPLPGHPTLQHRIENGEQFAQARSQRQLLRLPRLTEVDADEVTVRFYQEIYDGTGKLVEVHHKYPVDHGHQTVTS